MFRPWISRRPRLMVVLLALTMAMRVIVPSGFMPVADGDMIRVALCSGAGGQTVWLDKAGQVHKDAGDPAGKGQPGDQHGDQHEQQPCGFGALALGSALPLVVAAALPPLPAEGPLFGLGFAATIGRGLAAPPPPATGPPLLI